MAEIIYRIRSDEPQLVAFALMALRLWDAFSPAERDAACERGEVWDTPEGQAFKRKLEAVSDARQAAVLD